MAEVEREYNIWCVQEQEWGQDNKNNLVADQIKPKAMLHFESEKEEELYFINLLGQILEGVLEEAGEQEPSDDLFSSHKIPDITLRNYIQRVKCKAQCSNDSLIMALIYIDRYTQADPTFRLSVYSIHRLLLVCLLIAAKVHEDFYYDNSTFAVAGGVPVRHINELQLNFLKTLQFRVFIMPDQFNQYKTKILEAFE